MIYLDNNATTRVAPEVKGAMLPFLDQLYANPSSVHEFGRRVRDRVEHARLEIANLLGCRATEIVFTSCGTESINTALRGMLPFRRGKDKIVTTQVEHSAVLKTCSRLEQEGIRITRIGVDSEGMPDLEAYEASIDDRTALVSLMLANNETGVIFPIEEMARMAKRKGVPVHCDAVQAVGKIPINLSESEIDLLSFSGHKFHGPKGIGGLYIRRGMRVAPLLCGGGQEKNRRAGTEAVPAIIGMGLAARVARERMDEMGSRVRELRDRFEDAVLNRIAGVTINGRRAERLPNTSNVTFAGTEGEPILQELSERGVCISSGSACTADKSEPSHVLNAMGRSDEEALGALRFSLSRFTTAEEIDQVIELLPAIVERVRHLR